MDIFVFDHSSNVDDGSDLPGETVQVDYSTASAIAEAAESGGATVIWNGDESKDEDEEGDRFNFTVQQPQDDE
jgi:hypothetical protein